jgi:DNA-binding protein Fis
MSGRPPSSADGKALFGGRDAEGVRATVGRVVFGKRTRSPEREVSFRKERLRILGGELNLLFADHAGGAAFAVLQEDGEPSLAVGKAAGLSLSIEIEPQTGFFILYENSGEADCIVITASEERLIDHAISQVACHMRDLAPRTTDAAIDLLVGQSLEEVERRLVLHTVRHFRGDHPKAAFALGLPIDVLRATLRRYLLRAPVAAILPEGWSS